MSKLITQKILSLFFVIAALIQFGSTTPMLKKLSKLFTCGFCKRSFDPCEQPSRGTNIIDLPPDCLHEIFDFYAERGNNTESHSLESLLVLSHTCRDFRQAVKIWPLHSFFVKIDCKNKGCVIHIGNVFNNVDKLKLENCDFGSVTIVWPINLQRLHIKKCKNFDSTLILELTNLRKLKVKSDKLDESRLHGLTNLHELILHYCHRVKGTKPKELTNLVIFEVYSCIHFTELGLEGLSKLRKLNILDCPSFNDSSEAVEKLKMDGCEVYIE